MACRYAELDRNTAVKKKCFILFLMQTKKRWEKFSYLPEASNLQTALIYAEMIAAVPAPAVHPPMPPRC